ncbi:iron-containing redox enzyme family protein [Tumebacillus flagellatus]|uniref:Iron-containing redox enzyme family protein n=1 Tax=Tumebacillus flagellatus TaxID=1157490 RepID=A0A074LMF9_9BACL|nr:iron-containing redox enzyme family protein [Tumebacillus flagellatus]KEO82304.1 hypothetical protein EL26_16095 [Tumebacillus flagellatus]
MKDLLEQAIESGRNRLLTENPYFKLLPDKKDPADFEAMCVDLYHLSGQFLDAITMRYERFHDAPESIFKSHMEEERGHAEMLRRWMLQMGMKDPAEQFPSVETENYISLIYRAATTLSKNQSLLVINGAGEGTAQDYYMETYRHFQNLGFPKLNYWFLHAEVDQEHGNIMPYISELTEEEARQALHFVEVAMEAIYEMKAGWLQ